MRLPEPPEGILDPKIPWSRINPNSRLWVILKARLTGRPIEGYNYSSYVNISEADADRLIANMKKDPRGYPSLDQESGNPVQWMERQRIYQEWLVEEYLEIPFREETDKKIEESAIERRLNEIQEERKKKVEQAVELTTEVVEETVLEEPDVPMVVPTTELIPSPKEPEPEEQKPEKTRKKRSSLLGSMLKTFTRMENHFQKLIELTESSEADMVVISDAFKIQSDALTRGFQETTTLVTRVTQAVDLQTSALERIAKGKKDLDQKKLDAQESLNEEMALEQQQSSAGNARAENIGKGSGPGGGVGGSIAKVLGGAVIGKVLAGQGLKLSKGVGGKASSKISGNLLEKALGKETAETVLKTAGREAAETGVEKGAAKFIGKRIPLVGLGIGTFLALERAAKGDFLGAGLELASGAASTIPGGGTAASLGIDAALMARDSGMLPFAEGGLTQKSTFSTKRPGVTDLSPDLFKKMYQYEIDYEARNKLKFGRLYAEGYQKYFDSLGLFSRIGTFLTNLVDFFKNISSKIASGLGRGARNLLETFNPRTGTTTNQFKDVLPEGNPQLTSRFGPRKVSWGSKNHQGIDIGVDAGSRVVALEDGIVKDIYENYGGHGQAVVIDHGDGTRNVYGHVDSKVKVGDKVKKGNVVATVKYWPGSGAQPTDNTHLHLERRTGSSFKAVDPAEYLNERAEKLKPPESKPSASSSAPAAPKPQNQWWDPLKIIPDGGAAKPTTPGSGGVIHSTNIEGTIYTEREGGKYFQNGKPISKELYDAVKKNHPSSFGTEQRAKGGPVIANTPYVVGERGPEMFVPKQDGFVMNNQQTAGLVDMVDRMIFGGPKKGPSTIQYGTGAPKKFRGWAADESGAEILETLGGTRVKGASLPTPAPNTTMNKLVAMAPLEEQMATSVQIIRVNNTNTVPIPMPSDSSDEAQSVGNIFKDLHLASIS
jgi:murein DD-endopeptidase MepM/ murein hydrolase activator NlpD